MVSIIISESCVCIFLCVVLTCLLIHRFFLFLFFDGAYGPREI